MRCGDEDSRLREDSHQPLGLNIRLLEPFGYVDGCYCVTDEKVQNAANTFIQSIKEDGTLKKISEKWFGADVSAERQ